MSATTSRAHLLALVFVLWGAACVGDASPPLPSSAGSILLQVQGLEGLEALELELERGLPSGCESNPQSCSWNPIPNRSLPLQEEGGMLQGELDDLEVGIYRLQSSALLPSGRLFETATWVVFTIVVEDRALLHLQLRERKQLGSQALPYFVSISLDSDVVEASSTVNFSVQAGGGRGLLTLNAYNETPIPQGGTGCPPAGCEAGVFGAMPPPFVASGGSQAFSWTAPATTGEVRHPLRLEIEDEAGARSSLLVEVLVREAEGEHIKYLPVSSGLHNCFISSEDKAYCWGANAYSQVGVPQAEESKLLVPTGPLSFPGDLAPLSISPSRDAAGVAQGNGSCAILADSSVACWGSQYRGRLGDGVNGTARIHEPQLVLDETRSPEGPLQDAVQLAVGKSTSCALLGGEDAGKVKCWGEGSYGGLGNGQTVTSPYRKATWVLDSASLQPLEGVVEISAGNEHFCVLLEEEGMRCWGRNNRRQLGAGLTASTVAYPVEVLGLVEDTVTQISAGGEFSCALLESGKVKCWGYNNYGQLGVGDSTNRDTPTEVLNLEDAKQISAGYQHICALRSNGQARCWGYNFNYQLGMGVGGNSPSKAESPVDVLFSAGAAPLDSIVQIQSGSQSTCALRSDRSLRCWGYGFLGATGGNTTAASVQVPTLAHLPWETP